MNFISSMILQLCLDSNYLTDVRIAMFNIQYESDSLFNLLFAQTRRNCLPHIPLFMSGEWRGGAPVPAVRTSHAFPTPPEPGVSAHFAHLNVLFDDSG